MHAISGRLGLVEHTAPYVDITLSPVAPVNRRDGSGHATVELIQTELVNGRRFGPVVSVTVADAMTPADARRLAAAITEAAALAAHDSGDDR